MGVDSVFGGWRGLLIEGMRRLVFAEEVWKLRIGFKLQNFLLDAFHHEAPSRLNVPGALPTLPLVFGEPTFDDLAAENHGAQAEGTRWGRNEHPVAVEFVDLESFPIQGKVGDWWAVRVNEETEIPGRGDEMVKDKHAILLFGYCGCSTDRCGLAPAEMISGSMRRLGNSGSASSSRIRFSIRTRANIGPQLP